MVKSKRGTSEKFMGQIKEAVKIAEVKYPRKKAGRSFGSLTIAAAMQPCQMMRWMCPK